MADELLTLGANPGTDVRNTVYEEHTVSGSVVTFPDGADGVPLKKCEITLPASLDGYSEIDVKHCGGNILETVAQSKTQNGITWTVNADGSVTLEGTSTARTYLYVHRYHKIISKDATLTVSVEGLKDNGAYDVFVNLPYSEDGTLYKDTYGQLTYDYPSKTIQYTADKYIGFLIDCPANVETNQTIKVMVSGGSSALDFEPYTAPTTHTASLGRTIYGGTADVVNGQGTETHGLYTFTGNEVYVQQTNQVAVRVSFTVGSSYQTGLDTAMTSVEDFVAVGCGASNYLYVKTTMTAENLKTYMANHTVLFAYVLATPTDFTFEPVPIDSKLGNNTLWSEQGSNVEVTYYSEREVINNYNVTATQLTAIADAIREKKRTTAPILFEDFPDEIRTIETGGGGEDAITWVFTASGSADNHYYTAQEDGLYLAVAVRNQNTGCSISLPDGGDVVLTSTLLSPRFQMKVVRLTAGQRINLYIYNSTHVRGGWIFKLNVTPSTIAYTRAADQYGTYNMVNQGTSNVVISILATVWGNSYGGWDPTMKFFGLSPLNGSANIRIMYGIDMAMPAIPYGGPSTCQWILNIQED